MFLTKAHWPICPQLTVAQVLVTTYLEEAGLAGCYAPEKKNAQPQKAGGKHFPFVPVPPGRVAQKASLQDITFCSLGTALPRFCQEWKDECLGTSCSMTLCPSSYIHEWRDGKGCLLQ